MTQDDRPTFDDDPESDRPTADSPEAPDPDAKVPELEDAIQGLPPAEQKLLKRTFAVIAASLQISSQPSLLPALPPGFLRELNAEVPNGAERMFAMAESQATHRHHVEDRVVDASIERERCGQRMGFVLAMLGLVLAFIAAMSGHSWFGGAVALGDLAALAGVFVYGSRRQQQHARSREPPPAKESAA